MRTRLSDQLYSIWRFALRSIFVNYRRNDSEGESGRLFDDLEKNFGTNSVFMDVSGIEPGKDFRKAIDQSVASCTALLAVIGPQWLDVRDDAGHRRLDDANDFVRIELAAALQRQVRVVPVLVRSAKMPRAEELPDDLKELAYRNAVELTHARWKSDVDVLVRALRPYMEDPEAEHAPVDSAHKPINRVVEVSSSDAASSSKEIAVDTDLVQPLAAERISRELAKFIGPIADVIVKRAAKRCISSEQLCLIAAREIPSEADRARFMRACRP
jgi:hypothetical protein